jgi:hypothetical protein
MGYSMGYSRVLQGYPTCRRGLHRRARGRLACRELAQYCATAQCGLSLLPVGVASGCRYGHRVASRRIRHATCILIMPHATCMMPRASARMSPQLTATERRLRSDWVAAHVLSFCFVADEFVPNPTFRFPKPQASPPSLGVALEPVPRKRCRTATRE